MKAISRKELKMKKKIKINIKNSIDKHVKYENG